MFALLIFISLLLWPLYADQILRPQKYWMKGVGGRLSYRSTELLLKNGITNYFVFILYCANMNEVEFCAFSEDAPHVV